MYYSKIFSIGGIILEHLLWILFGLILAVIELISFTFFIIWIALAAVVTGIISYFMNGWLLQIIVFIFLAVVLLLISRPYARKLRNKKTYITEQESLLNKEGKVIRGVKQGK
ncbi:NfeD family protein [Alicyclobacillus sp. TC]|nr:NfeD family protein [Alicyclobacillus sp. TC]